MFARNIRWYDPWREFEALEEALDHFVGTGSSSKVCAYPPLNYYAKGDEGVITAELPGVDPADVEIAVIDKELTISGERKGEDLGEGETYHRRERLSGPFKRTVRLPYKVDAAHVSATFKNGVLTIGLPKAESEKPRKIAISAN